MAVPAINTTTSVLGFLANQYALYQPDTVDGQTGTWSIDNLPVGLTISATTGLISGVPTIAGIYIGVLKIVNSNGTGILPITFGIADCGYVNDAGIEVNVDLVSGAVTFPTSLDGFLHVKEGDTIPFLLGMTKNGVVLDVPLTSVTIGIKEFETDGLIALSNISAILQVGTYDQTRYRMYFSLTKSSALSAALSDYEALAALGDQFPVPAATDPAALITMIPAPCEIKITILVPDPTGGVDPVSIERSSQIFPMLIERSIDRSGS